ncbi:hypothetical protein SAMN05216420_10555 [Nitrosospira sp. Nl5]|nr:hypothetical protein SAMN05216420_10555 [Nitrosospira sp. Nl5]
MTQSKTKGLHPVYVARFLAVSRICLFVDFSNLVIWTYRKPAAKMAGQSIFRRFFGRQDGYWSFKNLQ